MVVNTIFWRHAPVREHSVASITQSTYSIKNTNIVIDGTTREKITNPSKGNNDVSNSGERERGVDVLLLISGKNNEAKYADSPNTAPASTKIATYYPSISK